MVSLNNKSFSKWASFVRKENSGNKKWWEIISKIKKIKLMNCIEMEFMWKKNQASYKKSSKLDTIRVFYWKIVMKKHIWISSNRGKVDKNMIS